MQTPISGIDVLLDNPPFWHNQNIALITKHAAKNKDGLPGRQALLQHQFNIQLLFSPEHGLQVNGADGAFIADGIDALTQLPVISLYGKKLQPSADDLKGIDYLLFDIPDVGARFYTYLWTLSYALEASAAYQIPLIVADRPNPISGNISLSEGPMLDSSCASFIGRWPMPIRHSCTLGELANYFNQKMKLNAPLSVIKIANYHRNSFQNEWGLPFIPTFPAIQHFESALCYGGLAFLEATNISEGRSTPYAFTIARAPWMDALAIAKTFNHLSPNYVGTNTIESMPTQGKFPNQLCHGVQLKIIDKEKYQSVFTGLLLIKIIKDLRPIHSAWENYVTNVNPSGVKHLDKLLGIKTAESLFDLPLTKFLTAIAGLLNVENTWPHTIKPYLLY
jgi:uncharacterized protein YbbC (DUF1343 family)